MVCPPTRQDAVTAANQAGAVAVAFTLVVNLARGYRLIAIGGTILVAGGLYWRWVRAGRPRRIEAIERQADAEDDADTREPVDTNAGLAYRS